MRKNVVKSFKMLDDVSMASSATSSEVNVVNLDQASIVVDWSGSSVNGAVVVQAKNGADGVWFDLDFGSAIALSTDSGSHTLILSEMPHYAIQIKYNRSAGTGTLNATIVAKTVGA